MIKCGTRFGFGCLEQPNGLLICTLSGKRHSNLNGKLKTRKPPLTSVMCHQNPIITSLPHCGLLTSSCTTVATLSCRLFGCPQAVKYRGSRLPSHYVMCRAASSGAGDSAESCWGEFLLIITFHITIQTFV